MVMYDSTECVFPVPFGPNGERPRVSDGWHAKGGTARGGKGHRGQDIMYRRPKAALTAKERNHPWGSKWYYMLPEIPALAILPGVVYRLGKLKTGYHVILDHGKAHGTGYHHLSRLPPGLKVGDTVAAGQPIGIIGGSPVGYGLVHLHHDTAIRGKFLDAGKWSAKWQIITLDEAWSRAGGTW